MNFRLLHLLSFIASISLCGCSSLGPGKQKDTEKPPQNTKTEPPKLVGRIASVPADKRFVLIQSYGPWNVESGSILTTRGPEERSANLRVTGESLGQFAAADIQSGLVEIGDAVYSRHTPKPPEPPQNTDLVPELPENQMPAPP